VVVQRDAVPEVAKAAEERREKEALIRRRLERGERGLDIYGWRDRLAQLGVEYEE
jgi:4-hydroxy-4-methyl-2-oxoglutarate aldolase